MAEYMQVYDVPAGASISIGVPAHVLGIYSPKTAVSIEWVFNGTAGLIANNANIWEPCYGFNPGKTSQIKLTNSATDSASVVLRLSDD